MKDFQQIRKTLLELFDNRILILDGAMGTMIQKLNLQENDFRGARFARHTVNLQGNNDLLSITRPDIIERIHKQYFEAGADFVETNTFNSNSISMADYDMQNIVSEMNFQSAQLACKAAAAMMSEYSTKPRFVLGSIGPTPKLASVSPKHKKWGSRYIDFQELENAYTEQAKALIQGGVDALLIETITDSLNCQAALKAIMQLNEELKQNIPLFISGTVIDSKGKTLSGETPQEFWSSVKHVNPICIGFNCGVGVESLYTPIRSLHQVASCKICVYPNAGLPNEWGKYEESPEKMIEKLKRFVSDGLVNLIGGCCGTSPEHIRAIAKLVED